MKIKIVLCLCMALCLTALGVSGYIIWNDYAQRQGNQQEFEELSRQTTIAATSDEAANPTVENTTLDEDTALLNVSQPAIHKRKNSAFKKIKNFLRTIKKQVIKSQKSVE